MDTGSIDIGRFCCSRISNHLCKFDEALGLRQFEWNIENTIPHSEGSLVFVLFNANSDDTEYTIGIDGRLSLMD